MPTPSRIDAQLEKAILAELAFGKTVRAIAEDHHICEMTVRRIHAGVRRRKRDNARNRDCGIDPELVILSARIYAMSDKGRIEQASNNPPDDSALDLDPEIAVEASRIRAAALSQKAAC